VSTSVLEALGQAEVVVDGLSSEDLLRVAAVADIVLVLDIDLALQVLVD